MTNENNVPSQELKDEEVNKDSQNDNQPTNPGEDTLKTQSEEVDYKQELEALKQKNDKLSSDNENYKKGLISTKKKLKEIKENEEEEEEPNNDLDLDSLVEKLDERAKKREEEKELKFQQEFIDNSIGELSSNEDEAELIRFHFEKTIQRSGFTKQSILEDVKRAKLLANEKRILRDNKELAESLARRSMINTAPHFNSEKKEVPQQTFKDIGLTNDDINLLQRTNASRVKRGLKPLTPDDIKNANN